MVNLASAESADSGFLEPETPFLRTALVFGAEGKTNRTRRGAVIPLGGGLWGCFDTDLLRWAAVWRATDGEPPLSYDSMPAVSYPDRLAKAERPPRLVGKTGISTPELPGAGAGSLPEKDVRKAFLTDGKSPVGPLPSEFGKWLGISLCGKTPVLHYQIGVVQIRETLTAAPDGALLRRMHVGAGKEPLFFRLGSTRFKTASPGASITGETLRIEPSETGREIALSTADGSPAAPVPDAEPAVPVFPKSVTLRNPAPQKNGPFSVRDLPLPTEGRPVRPTDIAFLPDGTALVAAFDGDIWRVSDPDKEQSVWTRVATGIYEPMDIAVDRGGRVFTLGRDQITELIDTNGDGHFDFFRCASDAFLQTLHSRDFATSLEIAADGSFLIAKGGIDKEGGDKNPEMSPHRGTILRISPDGERAEVLADGLRIPFVGLRADGEIFASDQQGNHIPSTPIHRIGSDRPFLGFAPTDFRKVRKPVEPLLYFPYQTNRSAAGFVTASAKAFPDLPGAFLQVSWDGRLFAIVTPKSGQAYSWQLPLQLPFPSLKAAAHPVSGRLYAVGIGISGYKPTTPKTLGLASIEQSAPFPAPVFMGITDNKVTVYFARQLSDGESVEFGEPALRMFDVKRTPQYGSGHFRWDGKPGEHHAQPGSALLSDRTNLVMHFAMIRKSDILDLRLDVSSDGSTWPLHLFARPDHLPAASKAELAALGKETAALAPGDASKGQAVFVRYGCNGCHSLEGAKLTGPPLNGLGSRAGAAEIRESILKPNAKVTEGYVPSMPSFEGVLQPQELEDLIAHLLTLK